MTYCVAMRLNAGMVFLSDSRTNAGLDQISTFRKMTVFEKPGERSMVMLAAGNLAITQAVRQLLRTEAIPADNGSGEISIWNARSMFDAVRIVGAAVRKVYERDAEVQIGESRRDQRLLPHDQKHLGPAPARGLRKHPGPDLGARRHRARALQPRGRAAGSAGPHQEGPGTGGMMATIVFSHANGGLEAAEETRAAA